MCCVRVAVRLIRRCGLNRKKYCVREIRNEIIKILGGCLDEAGCNCVPACVCVCVCVCARSYSDACMAMLSCRSRCVQHLNICAFWACGSA